jgi:short-subunit dehydrogenase
VRSFTLALAEETNASVGTAISVFAFNPGMVLTELLTDVEVIEGSEERLKRFPTVVRMWAKPPEAPAAKAVTACAVYRLGSGIEKSSCLTKLASSIQPSE